METFDIVVVGGGIVGLATAEELASRRVRVGVLEAEERLAAHQTGHNSGVLHSGLYYRPGSLKARLSTAGREALYRFAAAEGVPCRRTGKLVVARREEDLARLDELERRGRANGLEGLERLSGREVAERAPQVVGLAGLWVRETGLVDFAAAARALARRLVAAGGVVRTGARVTGVATLPGGVRLTTTAGPLEAGFLVACAGLQADRLARLAGLRPGVRIVPFRGEYCWVEPPERKLAKALARFPIYPVPDPALPFLGVHLTPTLDGRVQAGPTAILALARHGYRRGSVSLRDSLETLAYPGFWRFLARHGASAAAELGRRLSARRFARDVAALVPALDAGDLRPGTTGVRAQAMAADGTLLDDFHLVAGERSLHVLNAPSPAATAALAIGREIAGRVLAALCA